MRVVIAPDKFKGSLQATEVAEAVAKGVREAVPEARPVCVPMADGGEGTSTPRWYPDTIGSAAW